MKFSTTFKSKKAKIDEISKPPMGGMIPLKRFRYGSVIEHIADRIPLLQSILGNHVSKTLTIRMKEYICNVWPNTAKISVIMFIIDIAYINIYFFDSPIFERNSLLTANVWKNLSDNDNQ